MIRQAHYKLTGIAPVIPHNGQLANPLNAFAKALKKVSGKNKKSEADYEDMARIEYLGSLYMGQDGPIFPAEVLEGALVSGAKKHRQGPMAKSAVFVTEHSPIIYDGPRTPEELWEAGDEFRIVAPVVIKKARVIRTRPIFRTWATEVHLEYDDTQVDRDQLMTWWTSCGSVVGLCDWRPRHGRFNVVEL